MIPYWEKVTPERLHQDPSVKQREGKCVQSPDDVLKLHVPNDATWVEQQFSDNEGDVDEPEVAEGDDDAEQEDQVQSFLR